MLSFNEKELADLATRQASDADLMQSGARLEVTSNQVETARQEMEKHLREKASDNLAGASGSELIDNADPQVADEILETALVDLASSYPVGSEEEIRQLVAAVKIENAKSKDEIKDNSFAEALLKQYEGFIRMQSRRVATLYSLDEDDQEDCMQVGRLATLRAAEKFKPELSGGVKFISYLGTAVYRAMGKWCKDTRHMIHVPDNRIEDMAQLQEAEILLSDRSEQVSPERLMFSLGWSEKELDNTRMARLMRTMDSLDERYSPNTKESELSDTITDPSLSLEGFLTDPVDIEAESVNGIINEEIMERVKEVLLNSYNRNTLQVFTLYFGLDGYEPQTLKEIGSSLKLNKETIRRLLMRGLSQLRSDRGLRRLLI